MTPAGLTQVVFVGSLNYEAAETITPKSHAYRAHISKFFKEAGFQVTVRPGDANEDGDFTKIASARYFVPSVGTCSLFAGLRNLAGGGNFLIPNFLGFTKVLGSEGR
jgi:hypothetical protein